VSPKSLKVFMSWVPTSILFSHCPHLKNNMLDPPLEYVAVEIVELTFCCV